MKQTKELLMSKKWILAMVLLLATAFFVMQKGVLAKADSANEVVEMNGVIYTIFTEEDFVDSDFDLDTEKYNKVLSQIRANGGIYAATRYRGTSRAVTIENTIYGKPVMLVDLEYDGYDSNEITSMRIPANVVYFVIECNEISIDPNNQYYTVIDGVLYNKAVTEIIDYLNTKALKGVYNVPKTVTKLEKMPLEVSIVNIPASVVVLPKYDWGGSGDLKQVNVSSDNKMFSSENGVVYNKNKTTLIFYPPANPNKTYKMPKTVKSINECVLMRQKYLEKLIMSDKVTVIPSYFADGALKLKSVQLPKKLKKINGWAFEDCKKLKKVTIPSTLTGMNRAFAGCKIVVTIKSKKFTMDLDVCNKDNKNCTFVIKKGTRITCRTNYVGSAMKYKKNGILSIKNKGKNTSAYTIKALKTGKITVKCYSDTLKFKVVK